ncbi:MAG: hypothetical protein IPL11_18415 [Candidatus Accumulibacter sp.]|nr:hypothetical protein [Accumulibacter sp.]
MILLDFGATRRYRAAIVDAYRRLMASAVLGDRQEMSLAPAPSAIFGRTSGSGSGSSSWMSSCSPANPYVMPVPTISGIPICQHASATLVWP